MYVKSTRKKKDLSDETSGGFSSRSRPKFVHGDDFLRRSQREVAVDLQADSFSTPSSNVGGGCGVLQADQNPSWGCTSDSDLSRHVSVGPVLMV